MHDSYMSATGGGIIKMGLREASFKMSILFENCLKRERRKND